MLPSEWDAHVFDSVIPDKDLLLIHVPSNNSLKGRCVAKRWLHPHRLLVEFLIPVYNSYSALRLKKENAILSLLQYWYAFPIAISPRSAVFLVEAVFHVLSPVFDEL